MKEDFKILLAVVVIAVGFHFAGKIPGEVDRYLAYAASVAAAVCFLIAMPESGKNKGG